MMKKIKLLFVMLALMLAVPTFAAIDTIAVDVGISVFKLMPIGIVPFEEEGKIIFCVSIPVRRLVFVLLNDN